MSENITSIQQIVSQHMQWVANELRLLERSCEKSARITTGSWANQNNILAYVSFFPTGNMSENSIDSVLHLTLLEGQIDFVADICWSSGELIADVSNEVVTYQSWSDLLEKIEKIGKEASNELLNRLKQLCSSEPYAY